MKRFLQILYRWVTFHCLPVTNESYTKGRGILIHFSEVRVVCLLVWGSKFAITLKKIIVILMIGNMLVLLLSGSWVFETGSQCVAQAGLELTTVAQ